VAIQGVLQQVLMYPLAEFDGTMKSKDWDRVPKVPSTSNGEEEVKWVVPEKSFDELPAVLVDAPPLLGEEARYAQVRAVLDAMNSNPSLKPAMIKAAAEADDVWESIYELACFLHPDPATAGAVTVAAADRPVLLQRLRESPTGRAWRLPEAWWPQY
jgi:hypothetical protein